MSPRGVADAYEKLLKAECKRIEEFELDTEESVLGILSDPNLTTISYSVSDFMSGFKYFGKTGTSNNAHDNWFVGFDGRYLTAIWLGLEGIRDQKSLPFSGGSSAYKIYDHYKVRSAKKFYTPDCPWESDVPDANESNDDWDEEF